MNIRGVMFEISQETTNILWSILRKIVVDHQYYWWIDKNQSEVWDEKLDSDFFEKSTYTWMEFLARIKKNCKIVFLKMQAYSDLALFENLMQYDEFLNSPCQLIFLIYDCEYVEIYVKDTEQIDIIYRAAIEKGFKNVTYITDQNDARTNLNICI